MNLCTLFGWNTAPILSLSTYKESYRNTYLEEAVCIQRVISILIMLRQGCILNLKFIFLPPPTFLFIFFPLLTFIIMRGCTSEGKNFQPLFFNFVYFKSIGEKICMLFSNWGKNMPGGGQTEKYTPLC